MNIIYIVLDAFRADHVEHSPFLSEYADDNLQFNRVIAPSRWTLPSHASIASGKYPSENGATTSNSIHTDFTYFDVLKSHGYTLHGFSESGFAGTSYGYDEPFDNFEDTKVSAYRLFEDGDDISKYISGRNKISKGLQAASKSVRTGNPATIANFLFTAVNSFVSNDGWLAHQIPAFSSLYRHSPARTTNQLTATIEREFEPNSDNFVFVNYNIPHHPYVPPKDIRADLETAPKPFSAVRRLNDDYGHPVRFLQQEYRSGISTDKIRQLRTLYRGTAVQSGREIEQIVQTLQQCNVETETVVIITADHGEMLGESCVFDGKRRIGHVDSVSDHLLTVPLIVANPSFSGQSIDRLIELKNVLGYFPVESISVDALVECAAPDGDVAVAELPATTDNPFANCESVPSSVDRRTADEDIVIGFNDDWKVVLSSSGNSWVFRDSERVEEEPPAEVRNTCETHLDQLSGLQQVTESKEIDTATKRNLRDLGYIE